MMMTSRYSFRLVGLSKHTTKVYMCQSNHSHSFSTLLNSSSSSSSPSTSSTSLSSSLKSPVVQQTRSYRPVESFRTKPLKKQRPGLIAKKLGMVNDWDNNGFYVPLTVLEVENCQVFKVLTEEKNGYNALVLGGFDRNLGAARIPRAEMAPYANIGMNPKYFLHQFRVSPDAILPIGTEIPVQHFQPGQYVDCKSVSKGKGFQGVMKRWGFKGQCGSHGTSLTHRTPGSLGAQGLSKVIKGKKLPGRMGAKNVTVNSLKVFKIDTRLNLIFVKGSVPGPIGCCVLMKDALFKHFPEESPFPTYLPGAEYPLKENEYGEIYQPDLPKHTFNN